MVDLRINEALQTGAVKNQNYRVCLVGAVSNCADTGNLVGTVSNCAGVNRNAVKNQNLPYTGAVKKR